MEKLLNDWLTEREAAVEVGKALRTIRQWRKVGKGPPYARFGRTVKYRKSALTEYYRSSEINPARERRGRTGAAAKA